MNCPVLAHDLDAEDEVVWVDRGSVAAEKLAERDPALGEFMRVVFVEHSARGIGFRYGANRGLFEPPFGVKHQGRPNREARRARRQR